MASHAACRGFAASVLALLALAACSMPPHVATDYDRRAAFASFRSFTLIARAHPESRNSLVAQQTGDAIRAELTRKGFAYAEDPSHADFAVDFAVGVREGWDVKSYSAPAGPPFGPGSWVRQIDVAESEKGVLEIEVFDLRNHRSVWRGQADKELSQWDLEGPAPLIQQAVAAVLANFPPK